MDSTQIQESIFPPLTYPKNLASADPSLFVGFLGGVDSGRTFFITEPTRVNYLAKILLKITCVQ
jgi:hypothetical protein